MRDAIEGLVPVEPNPTSAILGQWQGPHAEEATNVLRTSPGVMGAPMAVGEPIRQVRRIAGAEGAFLAAHSPGPVEDHDSRRALGRRAALSRRHHGQGLHARRSSADEIADMLKREIEALIAEGCSYIQLDSLHYVERLTYDVDPRAHDRRRRRPGRATSTSSSPSTTPCSTWRRRGGVTVGMHMCRGNNRSAWHAEGSYEGIAEKAFQQLNVDRFLLEYDTDRAGGFEPLRFMPKDKMVVLGLISSKEPELESVDDLRRRIDEAAKYVPMENLAISPQCGFASTAMGNLLTWDEHAPEAGAGRRDGAEGLGLTTFRLLTVPARLLRQSLIHARFVYNWRHSHEEGSNSGEVQQPDNDQRGARSSLRVCGRYDQTRRMG